MNPSTTSSFAFDISSEVCSLKTISFLSLFIAVLSGKLETRVDSLKKDGDATKSPTKVNKVIFFLIVIVIGVDEQMYNF